MKGKVKGRSALIWFLSTVPVCVAPFVLAYLFCSYTKGKLLDIRQYTNDIILMICSIACGLMIMAFDESKFISDKIKIGSRIYSCFVAFLSGSFYFYMVGLGKDVNDYTVLVLGFILSIICIFWGIILGINHDKNKNIADAKQSKLCREFFEEAIPDEYKSAFEGIEKVRFCEMEEVNPINRLKAEKTNKK